MLRYLDVLSESVIVIIILFAPVVKIHRITTLLLFFLLVIFYPGSKGSYGLKTKLEWLLVRKIHGKGVMQKHQVKKLDHDGDTLK